MIDVSAPTLCAWCIEAAGQTPNDEDSHGICTDHADQLRMNYAWSKLQSIPSYLEANAAAFAAETDEETLNYYSMQS